MEGLILHSFDIGIHCDLLVVMVFAPDQEILNENTSCIIKINFEYYLSIVSSYNIQPEDVLHISCINFRYVQFFGERQRDFLS